MDIKERYKPYNFSSTKCHVITLTVQTGGIGNIEEKLPLHIACIKGIYVSVNISPVQLAKGLIFLTLNEGINKNCQLPIINTKRFGDCSHPLPLNEAIGTNAVLYGYYLTISAGSKPVSGTITIYLHYEERK